MLLDIHLHPMVVHFPIALFTTALVIELLSLVLQKDHWHPIAMFIYIAATLTTPFVALTGWLEQEHLHLAHPVLNLHRQFALLTLGTALISLPILWFLQYKKSKAFRKVFLIFSMIVVIFVSIAAYQGGRMVYEYGVGIES